MHYYRVFFIGGELLTMISLYDYFRSGAAYRTRIALNLKNLKYDQIPINLVKNGGEQFEADYQKINPQNLVPTYIEEELIISQSMAIMEYLEENYPSPPILPSDSKGRAFVRVLANMVSCDIHPLNNLRVRLYLVEEMGVTEEARKTWINHWIHTGFKAYELKLSETRDKGSYSFGDFPTIADACLIPQVANARLNSVDLSTYPNILEVDKICNEHPAFEKALPGNQKNANH